MLGTYNRSFRALRGRTVYRPDSTGGVKEGLDSRTLSAEEVFRRSDSKKEKVSDVTLQREFPLHIK